VWKRLAHPNIVPLLGVTLAPFQSISVWMPGGELLEYINMHSGADRLGLVGYRHTVSDHEIDRLSSSPMSQTVSATSTRMV